MSSSTSLLNCRSIRYIQRQPRLPSHEKIKFTAISYSLALLLLAIHTLLHYSNLSLKKKPLKLIRILPRPEIARQQNR
jgi:hypothetical protein